MTEHVERESDSSSDASSLLQPPTNIACYHELSLFLMSYVARIKPILLKASELKDADDRRRFLESECKNDPESLKKLLKWFDHEGNAEVNALDVAVTRFRRSFQTPDGKDATRRPMDTDEDWKHLYAPKQLLGETIGKYELVELLGEGGMGVVYRAKQTSPIQRDVALKLIHPWLVSSQLVQEFEAERKTLERMDHPGITGVLDAGETEWNTPFYVMELVLGNSITKYSNDHELSMAERLELFVELCWAVQHAHQKGIVHRDLKPSNILVTEKDQKRLVKVIDFGIARAIDQAAAPMASSSPFVVSGTPMYMSPEQASTDRNAADTRSDVYSLGLVLYELLTRTPPFDKDVFRSLSGASMRRFIQETDPPRPSSRIIDKKSPAAKGLQMELDWLVMKAIDKSPDRRYPTAMSLAEDVQRFLDGDIVQARPASWSYQLRKWTSRNRRIFVPLVMSAVFLVAATIVSTLYMFEARRAQRASQRLVAISDLNISFQAFKDANLRYAREMLERHVPYFKENEKDNFAWNYLRKQLSPELFTYQADMGLFGVSFHPSGDYFASSHDEGGIRVWKFGQETPHAILTPNASTVRSLAYSKDGNWLATGNVKGDIWVWKHGEKEPTFRFKGHKDEIWDVRWIDSNRFLTCGGNMVHVWDMQSMLDAHANRRASMPRTILAAKPEGRLVDAIAPVRTIGPFAGSVDGASCSPDGKRLAVVAYSQTPGYAGELSVFDLESGELLTRANSNHKLVSVAYQVGSSPLSPASFESDGATIQTQDIIAVGSQRGELGVIAFGTDEEGRWKNSVSIHHLHTSNIYALEFSSDGKYLVSASKDANLRVWNTRTWECTQTVQSHLQRVNDVTFQPGTNFFVSASSDGTARCFDANHKNFRTEAITDTSRVPYDNYLPSEPLEFLMTDPIKDSDLLIVNGGVFECFVVSKTTGEMDYLPLLYADSMGGGSNSLVVVEDDQNGLVELTVNGPRRIPNSHSYELDMNGDGKPDKIAGFGNGGTIVWQSMEQENSNKEISFPRLQGEAVKRAVYFTEVTPDNSYEVYQFVQDLGVLKKFEYRDGRVVRVVAYLDGLFTDLTWWVHQCQPAESSAQFVGNRQNGRLICFPLTAEGPVQEHETDLPGIHVLECFSSRLGRPIDRIAAVDANNQLHLFSYDMESGLERLASQQLPFKVEALHATALRSGNVNLYGAGASGVLQCSSDSDSLDDPRHCETLEGADWATPIFANVAIYDTANREIISAFYTPELRHGSVALSSDGTVAATGGVGGPIRLWSGDGRPSGSIKFEHRDSKVAMQFSNVGHTLAGSSGDDIWISKVLEGKPPILCKGHENAIAKIVFSPSGSMIASCSEDRTIRVWSASTGERISSLVGLVAEQISITFTPDEKGIVGVTEGGTVTFWDLATGVRILEIKVPAKLTYHVSFLNEHPGRISVLGSSDSRTPQRHTGAFFTHWDLEN